MISKVGSSAATAPAPLRTIAVVATNDIRQNMTISVRLLVGRLVFPVSF